MEDERWRVWRGNVIFRYLTSIPDELPKPARPTRFMPPNLESLRVTQKLPPSGRYQELSQFAVRYAVRIYGVVEGQVRLGTIPADKSIHGSVDSRAATRVRVQAVENGCFSLVEVRESRLHHWSTSFLADAV